MIMKNKDKKASDILSRIFSKNYEREGKGVINLTQESYQSLVQI